MRTLSCINSEDEHLIRKNKKKLSYICFVKRLLLLHPNVYMFSDAIVRFYLEESKYMIKIKDQ